MNKHRIFSGIIFLMLSTGFLPGLTSCKENDEDANTDTFTATLNGSNEVPQNNSTATGTATLTFNQSTKIFNLVVNYSGLEAVAGHVHKGAPGVSGAPVFPFNPPLTSPINYSSVPLTADQEKDLFDGNYYVNLHSATFPGGEIRGQLVKK